MRRAKAGVSLLLIMVFLAGLVAPVPECFVTRLLCPRAKPYACSAAPAQAPARHSAVAACCAKPEKRQVSESRHHLAPLRSWMKPYAPEREIVEVPSTLVALLPSPLAKPVPQKCGPLALNILNPGSVPEPIPILLGKESFLI